MASCNKNDGGSPSITVTVADLANEIDQSRLSLIGPNTSTWTRSESYAGDIAVEQCPATPTDNVRDLSVSGTDASYGNDAYSALVIPAGASYSGAIAFCSGLELYVEGDLTLAESGSWGSGTIYVADGGSVTFPAGYVLSDIVVKSWGSLIFNGDFSTTKTSTTTALYNYSADAISVAGTLQLNTDFESLGSVSATKLEIVGADLWDTPRTVKFGGCVSVKSLDVSNYGEVYLSAMGVVADVIDLHSYSNLYMTSGTLIQVAKELNFENRSCFSNLGGGYAVIDVTTAGSVLTIDENAYLARINGGPVDLNYLTANFVDDKSEAAVEWAANVVFNQKSYIAANDCHSGYGDSATENDPKEPVLEHDATVTSPDIERISATSIDFNNGLVFVSWHEAEENYQGYIDVVNMSGMEIAATLHTYDYDFNHMYINNGVAYVTGGQKKGAFYAEVLYSTGASSVGVEIKTVEGASGNCITIEGANKWVVSGSQGGVTLANAADEQIYTELVEAKFVEPYNGGMAVLAGIASTYIHEYDLSGGFKKSYKVGSVDPVDGKNTLHEDGDTIYACLSTGGLVACKDGVVVKSLDSSLVGSVNCVETDDDYIYIANGTRGLMIIKKSDWSLVKEYKLGDASANYVKLGDDGYIYVAYGLKGVHRFRLVVE